MMNMNQCQANQNHTPYFKVRYETLIPRLKHVKRAFDNEYFVCDISQHTCCISHWLDHILEWLNQEVQHGDARHTS